jgi:RND family efflux transporter MFP subunit
MKAGPRAETLDAARATVRDFDAQLQLAKRNLERRQRLVNTDALSKEDFEVAQSTVARTEAARANAQKTLEDLALGTRFEKIETQEATIASLQESIASAQVELEQSEIRSPYDGSIIDRSIHEGAVASPGSNIFVVSEVSQLEAHFGVSPQMMGSLTLSQKLELTVRGVSINATLKSIVPQVDDETRTLQMIASIPQSENVNVMAGDIAKMELKRFHKLDGIWLKTAAVTQGQRGLWECYVVEKSPETGASCVARRSIEVQHSEGDRVLVRGAIHDGDWVVCSAVNRVVDRQVVNPIERESK